MDSGKVLGFSFRNCNNTTPISSLSLSTFYLEIFYLNVTHPSDHYRLCPLKCQY